MPNAVHQYFVDKAFELSQHLRLFNGDPISVYVPVWPSSNARFVGQTVTLQSVAPHPQGAWAMEIKKSPDLQITPGCDDSTSSNCVHEFYSCYQGSEEFPVLPYFHSAHCEPIVWHGRFCHLSWF